MPTQLFDQEPFLVKVSDLLLDVDNPRLVSVHHEKTQVGLLSSLYSEMAVDEVALSIAENGYFKQEPLFVIKEMVKRKFTGKYVVVEGNRRFAAVLLLTNSDYRKKLKATDIPAIDSKRAKELVSLPVVEYPSKQDIWQYLGFRHINGIKEWDSFSKAFYVAEVHEKYGVDISEIALKIGDRHTTVKRLYRGYTVLRQAEKVGFNREDRFRNRFHFSHLYTALDQPDFQKFLSLDPDKSLQEDPVPKPKRKELLELMTWLYGSKEKGREPVVKKQNPDLGKLREIIASPPALAALRTGSSLEISHDISIGDQRRFEDAVYLAHENLKQALGVALKGFDKSDKNIKDAIEGILETADELADRTINRKARAQA